MDLFMQKAMKGPSRPAPGVPGHTNEVNRYSPVTNWNDDPFGADVFEPAPNHIQKKLPPPRPPPPKIASRQPDVPLKPSHFVRKPTVLSTLLSRRNKSTVNNQNVNASTQNTSLEFSCDVDTNKMFPKCEPKNVQTGALIDLSSPPSSPTFTTRSSSDGLSVDSFGSDATTSTNHHNILNGGNISQAESGFEDDFDLFLHSRKTIAKDDTYDDLASIDPFSPQSIAKPPVMKKQDLYDIPYKSNNQVLVQPALKGPTIIRGRPARPKPPDNSSILKNAFGASFPVASMNINTTTPIQKVNNGFGETYNPEKSWEEEGSPERESSPPMPSVPPPPPPVVDDEPTSPSWQEASPTTFDSVSQHSEDSEGPHAVALFDYFTDHPDDLCFSVNTKIKLIRRVDEEWLLGSLRSGIQGVFPSNYVEIKVPLPNEPMPHSPRLATVTALYDFEPDQPGDLRFRIGDAISVLSKISEEWYFGECNGIKGHFPANYVQISQFK